MIYMGVFRVRYMQVPGFVKVILSCNEGYVFVRVRVLTVGLGSWFVRLDVRVRIWVRSHCSKPNAI